MTFSIDGPSRGRRALLGVAILCRTTAALLLLAMTCLVVLQIVGRNLFDSGMPWADELARYCCVAIVFLCVPLIAARGEHVAVDLVPGMLPAKARRIALLCAEMMVLAFSVLMLWALYGFLSRAWMFATPTLRIPNWVFYAPVVICFFLTAIVVLVRIASVLKGGHAPGGEEIA